ncbi:unnamed protein product [Zymoseptoria tritici ST99CH_1A5]|uniref:Uncharacterized protein n=3 Tax=Zymoseptoria tritici TaxID=1047171 RepID=F9XFT2_ZYMTI|nr:uncharacterized protein MYCGRDRAFT_100756 [Zymoseptoria tritici IPO323]EGP85682.1 hypothetical protein MYCGRDRAFT_100756 [Zymoseptoria tritici IPO323]SMQ52492.1 unnamed protein product [Zymoseptoria tritici ST99CH_3D7]SMY26127.1 unnamed protein product [Zymoseptoria tritici ST99CH_1A5]
MAYQTLWLKKVIIPFWVVQTLAALVYLGFAAWNIVLINQYLEDDDDYYYPSSYSSSYSSEEDTYSGFLYVGVGIALGLAALTALFNIIEMILFAVKKLSPVTVVVFNSINTAIWTAMLMLLIIASIVRNSIGDWILVIILFLTSLGKLIYSSVMLHRRRRGRFAHRGEYTPAAREADTSYHPTSYGGPTPEISQSTQPGGAAHGYYSPASVGARG